MLEIIKNFKKRLKRKLQNLTVLKYPTGHGPGGKDNISLVLYFDYEREFGNPLARTSAEVGFNMVLDILARYNIKATWNCVGLIAEYYSQSIERLIQEGHEIACHTYYHIVPLETSYRKLLKDIEKFKITFKKKYGVEIEGFHPPEDAWSKSLLEILLKKNFTYHIVLDKKLEKPHAHFIALSRYCFFKRNDIILRIPSVSDDWQIISEGVSGKMLIQTWKRYIREDYRGLTFAIGFHPWIIGKEAQFMKAFENFIYFLVHCNYVKIFTGKDIANWYKNVR